MLATAKTKFVRGAASKARLVCDAVRGMNALEALTTLKYIEKRSTYYIGKTLASAIANAKNKGLNVDDLVISKITADEGPRWKRFRAASFGRAAEILKRTSHITIELDLKKVKASISVPAAPVAAPVAVPAPAPKHKPVKTAKPAAAKKPKSKAKTKK